jgi:hypothetical protein
MPRQRFEGGEVTHHSEQHIDPPLQIICIIHLSSSHIASSPKDINLRVYCRENIEDHVYAEFSTNTVTSATGEELFRVSIPSIFGVSPQQPYLWEKSSGLFRPLYCIRHLRLASRSSFLPYRPRLFMTLTRDSA